MREFHFGKAELERSTIAYERRIKNQLPSHLENALHLTLAGLERIRALLDHPMQITSGYRCHELNAAVGGEPDSQHLSAEAADFVCPDYGDPEKVFRTLAKNIDILGIDQLILEPGWVHVSFTVTPRLEALRLQHGGYVRA
jgi:uncharacterized protein YcbK (DUF882 family)